MDTSRCDVAPALRLNAELRGITLRWRQEGREEDERERERKTDLARIFRSLAEVSANLQDCAELTEKKKKITSNC